MFDDLAIPENMDKNFKEADLNDPIIRRMYQMFRAGRMSMTEMFIGCTIMLYEKNKLLEKQLEIMRNTKSQICLHNISMTVRD